MGTSKLLNKQGRTEDFVIEGAGVSVSTNSKRDAPATLLRVVGYFFLERRSNQSTLNNIVTKNASYYNLNENAIMTSIRPPWFILQSCECYISVSFSQVSLQVYAEFVYVQKYVTQISSLVLWLIDRKLNELATFS